MKTRRASCACGQLTAVCTGDPVRISMCHCHACQQRTGSAFGIQARFPDEAVSFNGPATEFVRTGDSGGRIAFKFCPTCGTTLSWQIDSMPGVVAIATGTFTDQNFPPPTFSVYESRRHNWLTLPDSVTEHWD